MNTLLGEVQGSPRGPPPPTTPVPANRQAAGGLHALFVSTSVRLAGLEVSAQGTTKNLG